MVISVKLVLDSLFWIRANPKLHVLDSNQSSKKVLDVEQFAQELLKKRERLKIQINLF